MARRPFLTSFSWLAGESNFAGSKGYQSRKPDCACYRISISLQPSEHQATLRYHGCLSIFCGFLDV